MLTLAAIKENPEEIIRKLAKKHFDAKDAIEKVLDLDKTRRTSQAELDTRLSELKTLSAQVGQLMKEGKKVEAETVKNKVSELKEHNKTLEANMKNAEAEITVTWFRKERVLKITLSYEKAVLCPIWEKTLSPIGNWQKNMT